MFEKYTEHHNVNSLKPKQNITPFEKIQRLNTVKNVNEKINFLKKTNPIKMKSFL